MAHSASLLPDWQAGRLAGRLAGWPRRSLGRGAPTGCWLLRSHVVRLAAVVGPCERRARWSELTMANGSAKHSRCNARPPCCRGAVPPERTAAVPRSPYGSEGPRAGPALADRPTRPPSGDIDGGSRRMRADGPPRGGMAGGGVRAEMVVARPTNATHTPRSPTSSRPVCARPRRARGHRSVAHRASEVAEHAAAAVHTLRRGAVRGAGAVRSDGRALSLRASTACALRAGSVTRCCSGGANRERR
jgi:hypothetical protein